MSFFNIGFAGRLNSEAVRQEARATRLERERQAREKRAKEVQNIADACSQVGGFSAACLVEFINQHGTTRDFCLIRALSRELEVPWHRFEGTVTIGTVNEPNAGGFHTLGDTEFDFEGIGLAQEICPRLSVLVLRECHVENAKPLGADSLAGLGFDNSVTGHEHVDDFDNFGRREETVCCLVGPARVDAAPNLLFENLQILRLEGNVRLQHLVVGSVRLQEVSIGRNKSVKAIHFVGLPHLETIKLEMCPNLLTMSVANDTCRGLTSLHVVACQQVELDSVLDVVKSASPLMELVWHDMFLQRHSHTEFEPSLSFLRTASEHVQSLNIERYHPVGERTLRTLDLDPMGTVFDVALSDILGSALLSDLSIRGSSIFSALPCRTDSTVTTIDASSCRQLKELLVLAPLNETREKIPLVRTLIMDDCPCLETPVHISALQHLCHLSMQGCTAINNDIFRVLPYSIKTLDLTACSNLGDFSSLHDCYGEEYSMYFPELRWCSFKQTSLISSDVLAWVKSCPVIEYLNFGQLKLEGLSLSSLSLTTLMLMNVDLSQPFRVSCPLLKHIWVGNRFRGWPYREARQREIGSCLIHGESLVSLIASADSSMIEIYLCEDFGLSFNEEISLQYSLDAFFTSGMEPCDIGGPALHEEWHDDKAEAASLAIQGAVRKHGTPLAPFSVTIARGPSPRIISSPRYIPRPPDAKWHRDFSRVGGGHDGGYSEQCETDWY